MRKILTFLAIILCLAAFTKKSAAQVVTEIDSARMCFGAATSMPVIVQNMNAVDTLRLVLAYDKQILAYVDHFNVNAKLASGTLSVVDDLDSIIITWAGSNRATLAHDTLVWIKFKGIATGHTALHWKEASSYYHSSGTALLTLFNDGYRSVGTKMNVLLTQIDATCASKCDANFTARASGGVSPYIYRWNNKPGRFDSIQTGICAGSNLISITDTWGCKLDSNYIVKGLPGANVKVIVEGNEDTTVYIQNPVLKFSFQEVSPTHVVQPPLWEFGDGDTATAFNATHVYAKSSTDITKNPPQYTVKLHVTNENGCDSLIEIVLPIKDAKIKPITSVITPNGDGKNDMFMIINHNKTGSSDQTKITSEFQHIELVVFDRWGRKVYSNSNYQNDWKAEGVPDGSYYYELKTVGFYTTDVYKGSITIIGSQH